MTNSDDTLQLHDAYKRVTDDQDKILAPEETVRRFRRRLAEVDLDILADTRRIDNGRLDIPVFFSRCGRDARRIIGTRKQMGKGATPAQAEASAVMELAERFSFFDFCRREENFVIAPYRQVSQQALPFEQVAASVHDNGEDLEVAREFFADLPMRWTRAYDLTRGGSLLVPFDWFYAINEFNGPSAGNCREEALVQGICEIVERHVSARIGREKLELAEVRPESVTQPLVVEMLDKYRRAGVRIHISDFSLDMGIPTLGVLAWDPSTFPQHSEIVWTAGTAPDPQKALSRTLTEVAQLGGDFNSGSNFVASGLPKFSRLEEADFVRRVGRRVDIGELADASDDNIRREVQNCVAALARRGMQVFVIDTMHPQLEVPAFYTIVPGAHFRERAVGTSVAMFTAKLMVKKLAPQTAGEVLERFDRRLGGRYYLQFYLGQIHLSGERLPSALTCFQRALELGPQAEDAASIYSYMGVCLKEMGEYRRALEVLSAGLGTDSERTDIHNLMGFCHFKLRQHRRAIACFESVLELDPGSAIDYANIASNYRDLGDTEKAIEYYRTALALDPGIEFARTSLERLTGEG